MQAERSNDLAVEHRYQCFNRHEWTTKPNLAGRPMQCPHCGTVTIRRWKPDPDAVESIARIIWDWNAEHAPGLKGFPYDRLIEPTKEDLRLLAKRMLPHARQVEDG
jgi:hypothetical protein